MLQVTLIGHLGQDAKSKKDEKKPELHVISFSVAHTEKYIGKDKEGKEVEKEKTVWVTCFKRQKKNPKEVLKYLKQGREVTVIGNLGFYLSSYEGKVQMNATANVRDMHIHFDKKEQDATVTKQDN